MKKKLIILVIILAIIIITSMTVVIYQFKEKEKMEDAKAITFVQNRTVPFGKEVYVSDFIESLNGTIMDNIRIDTTNLGEKEVTLKYKNHRNKKKERKFTIEVIDDVPPMILLGNAYTVKKGFSKDLTKSIFSGDNCDDNPTREIQGEYNLNEIGKYNLALIVTDSSGNQTTKDFILNVIENEEKKTTKKEKIFIEDVIQKHKTENRKIGIDVSKWQGEIDWKAVKDAGVEFVMIRIGTQVGFDEQNVIDEYFYQNIDGAKEVGLEVGVYFFSYAKTEQEAEAQAEWVIENLKDYKLDLPVVFDWESWSSFSGLEISFYKINEIAHTFLKKIKDAGYEPALYSSKTYLEKIWTNTKYNTWLAHYTSQTDYAGEYQMWQLCDTGVVNGINGDVDIDVLY